MGYEFEADPEYQAELDWVDDFVREKLEPLDFVIKHPYDRSDPVRERMIPPLQAEVRARGLWACHLGPNLGGPGYGQVKLAHDVNRSTEHKRIGGAGTDSKSSLSYAVSAMGWGQRGCEA